jgi:hypothetical protein
LAALWFPKVMAHPQHPDDTKDFSKSSNVYSLTQMDIP